MARRNDQASGSLAPPSKAELKPAQSTLTHDRETGTDEAGTTDTLSDVLETVKLTGALFFLTDASSPWGVEVPDGTTLAPSILPGAQHVMSYHIVTRGSCWGGLVGEPAVALEEGDVIVFPHGDAYVMSMAPSGRAHIDAEAALEFLRMMSEGLLPFVVGEGGGGPDRMHLVCGFLGWDVRPFNPLLATLPRLLHVRGAAGSKADLLGPLIELTIAESRERRAGGECTRLRLSELLFVEVVRRYLDSLTDEQTGWLAGLRDPFVGRALVLLHERPAHPWKLEALARAVGLSRSALADRFTHLVGQPPMQYLTSWRMQVAARQLTDGAQEGLHGRAGRGLCVGGGVQPGLQESDRCIPDRLARSRRGARGDIGARSSERAIRLTHRERQLEPPAPMPRIARSESLSLESHDGLARSSPRG